MGEVGQPPVAATAMEAMGGGGALQPDAVYGGHSQHMA